MRILAAFARERTWKQVDLAAEVEVSVKALRKRLDELTIAGFPIESEADPPHVYWSVPRGWVPAGVLVPPEEVPALLRLLGRLPRSPDRERLRALVVSRVSTSPVSVDASEPVIAPSASEEEQTWLGFVEDGARRGVALHFHYFSHGRGELEWRHASVHRVLIGTPARFVARCHRDDTLKWFRVDNIVEAKLDPGVAFLDVERRLVDAFVEESSDGFREDPEPTRYAFDVRSPESRWVSRNLLPGMTTRSAPGGIRVEVKTAGVLRVARFVVGLGRAARTETPELARLVRELAEGALEGLPHTRAVGPKGPTS